VGKRRKNRHGRPPSTQQLLTERVGQLLAAQEITPMMVFDMLLMGHRVYSWNGNMTTEGVWKSILDAFRDHERYYLTPEQMANLNGREKPLPQDHEHLETS
jgi:hypothetical protein